MIPKPPFPWDFDSHSEEEAFETLKARLAGLWGTIFPGDDEHYTSVVVPSLTLDEGELRKVVGATFYEERLLFLLIRLRNPRARMVYVTSQPVHPLVLEYYFQLLAGIPASHARSHLSLLCAHDASPRPLTEKILERPRLIQRIRAGIIDPSKAYLTVYNATPLERRLAVTLDLPLNGLDPRLLHHGTKSGSRRIFLEAGVPSPPGAGDLRDEADVVEALVGVQKADPQVRRAVLKLDSSFSGEGNAVYTYPEDDRSRRAVEAGLDRLAFAVPEQTRGQYFEQLARKGGVVEELMEGNGHASPSVQMRVNPRGQVILVATHDQILGGPLGQTYVGCRFPAAAPYRAAIQEAGVRVGQALAARGVVSRFGVDFVVRPRGGEWDVRAIEINLRMGATTHPFLALRFLTGGELDPVSGEFRAPSGLAKSYRSTDNLCSPAYRGLSPEDLIEIVTANHLHYDSRTETGVLFHLIGALSEFGKVGLTAIGNSVEEVEALYGRTLAILDRETACNLRPADVPPASQAG
jgi:PGM1 C-terminal domain